MKSCGITLTTGEKYLRMFLRRKCVNVIHSFSIRDSKRLAGFIVPDISLQVVVARIIYFLDASVTGCHIHVVLHHMYHRDLIFNRGCFGMSLDEVSRERLKFVGIPGC